MTTILNNIPVYDPTAVRSNRDIDPTSTKDLSQNFLKMLTVQLQNQDPMNPMDNAAMTAQLAQLNMVDGINKLNQSFSALSSQVAAANFMNLSGSVGRALLAEGQNVALLGQPITLAADLSEPASQVTAQITSLSGDVIRTIDLGARPAGMVDFIWDGFNQNGEQAFDGFYNLSVQATTAGGVAVGAKTFVGSYVWGIGQEGSDIRVDLADGRSISSTEIFKWLA
jgi:flagellar basal-body rod modification protein FlgD